MGVCISTPVPVDRLATSLFTLEPCPPFPYGLVDKTIVHHYLPANFPMHPCRHMAYVNECKRSWELILHNDTNRIRQYPNKSGMRFIMLYYPPLEFNSSE